MKRNSIRKNLIITVIAMLTTFVSLVSSTYAWFAVTNDAKTELLTLNVGSSMALTISTEENGDYKYTLTTADIKNYLDRLKSKGDDGFILAPVSTVACSSFFAPSSNTETEVSGFKAVNAEDGMYLELPVYLKANIPAEIYLSNETSVRVKNSAAENGQGEVDRVIRIGFKTMDNTVIFEPNAAKDMSGRRQNSYGQPGENYAVAAINPLKYELQKTYTGEELLVTYSGHPEDEASVDNTDITGKTKLTELEKDEAKRVSVYLWIEGTDWDCVNELLESTIEVNLKFIAVKK